MKLKCRSSRVCRVLSDDKNSAKRCTVVIWMLLVGRSSALLAPYGVVRLGYFESFWEGNDVEATKSVSSIKMCLLPYLLEDLWKVKGGRRW